MESLTEKIRTLVSQGYAANFCVSKGQLCIGGKVIFADRDVNLDATFRIEADSDAEHQSIVFAITCKNPTAKGVLINSFGIYSDASIDEFVQKIDRHG